MDSVLLRVSIVALTPLLASCSPAGSQVASPPLPNIYFIQPSMPSDRAGDADAVYRGVLLDTTAIHGFYIDNGQVFLVVRPADNAISVSLADVTIPPDQYASALAFLANAIQFSWHVRAASSPIDGLRPTVTVSYYNGGAMRNLAAELRSATHDTRPSRR